VGLHDPHLTGARVPGHEDGLHQEHTVLFEGGMADGVAVMLSASLTLASMVGIVALAAQFVVAPIAALALALCAGSARG
jgi:hypothetical protein